jgi:hypothetical protein
MDKVQALNKRPSSELELQDFEPQSMKRRLNGVSSNVRGNSARGGAKSHGTPSKNVKLILDIEECYENKA